MALFRIPKFTEYAVRGLVCLARTGQPMSVREIAEQEGIHPASLAKILHTLCWQGLVHSKRGRQGGFWLAREPASIRVKEVVEIFQGPLHVPATSEPSLLAVWESLYDSTRQALEKLTLADLLQLEVNRQLPRAAASSATPQGRSRPKGGTGGT